MDDWVNSAQQEQDREEISQQDNSYSKKPQKKKRSGIPWERYIIYAVLLLLIGSITIGFYMGYQYLEAFQGEFNRIDQRMDEFQGNFEQINEDNRSIRNKVNELEDSLHEVEKMQEQLETDQQSIIEENEALEEERDNLEEENEELRDMLSLRYNNYRAAINLEGADISVLSRSGFSAAQIDTSWRRLGANDLVGTGRYFVEAEEETGVNALVLAGIAACESGFGRSIIAREKNNLFGYGASDGSAFESAVSFDSHREGTITVASHLQRNYLSRSGRYYQGDNLHGINRYYATDRTWADKIARMMKLIAVASVNDATVERWKKYIY